MVGGMRRIYESRALERDENDPHMPSGDDREEPEPSSRLGARMVNWTSASHAFMPTALRHRAIAVSVETDREVYAEDDPVILRVTMRNRLPFPVSLKTASPVLWSWAIDGVPEASRYDDGTPDEAGLFTFDRSERKVFTRRWHQRFREDEREWSRAGRGEFTVSAGVNVEDAAGKGLTDETTIRIE